ncbi:MAG: ATP-binding cassette domain-containing protein [Devosia sp.]
MSEIINPVRKTTVWGKEIEPEFLPRPVRGDAPARGVGIRLEGVEKSFGDVTVLRGIDLEVPEGQFLAIVGKSGCGKSTLLRLLVGLDEVSGGTIAFTDGGRVTKPNSRIVFQEPRLLPWAKVGDNVAVGLGERVGRAERSERVRAALSEVQLTEKVAEWPARLSGGQRQRVALARALVSQPDFLALDEPLGALDALTRITMQGLVERVWREQKFTALFVTHDVAEAVALADRVIVLDEGRIALDVAVNHERPRERGAADLAELEGRLLKAIFA